MTSGSSDRRFLIAAGTWQYKFNFAELPSVPDDLQRIVDLLSGPSYGGYRRKLTRVSAGPKAGVFRARLRAWLNSRERKSDDIVVFYYSGHGYITPAGQHVLAASNTNPRNSDTAIPARFFVEALESSSVRRMLLILDVCFAGAAISDDMTRLAANLSRSRGADEAPQVWILAAARREVAEEGAFSHALWEAFQNAEAEAGDKQEYLHLDTIFDQINHVFGNTVSQRACLGAPHIITELQRFFRNPKYKKPLPEGIDLETQRAILQGDLESHWGPRSRGVEIDAQKGWYFSGRRRALAKIIGWIGAHEHEGQILYVTGRPGTGKSAVLARLVTLSDPTFRRYAPLHGASDDSIPPLGLIDAALHCRGKTVSDVLGEMSNLLDITAANGLDLATHIRDQHTRSVIVIDALDEAVDPEIILWDLLQMVAAAGARVVVGVRSETVTITGDAEIVDLHATEYIELNDIVNYVISLLTEGNASQNPYHEVSAAKRMAEIIAERAFPNFLIARMVARAVIDGGQEMIEDELPKTSGRAFDEYLARFGLEEPLVRDLLAALAYAEGQGLPRGKIWIAVARAVSGGRYGSQDVNRVLTLAASYIVEEIEQDLSVYRLYHRQLAEHLQLGGNPSAVHKKITRELRLLVAEPPESPGMGWLAAPRYIKRHLATHAAIGGDIEELLSDAGFLLSADPERLLLALPPQLTGDAQATAEVYQKAIHLIRNKSPGDAASYLEYSAQLDGAVNLAAKVSALQWPRQWHTAWAAWDRRSPHRVIGECSIGAIGAVMTRTTKGSAIVASDYSFRLLIWNPWTGQVLPGHGREIGDIGLPMVLNATPADKLPTVLIGYQSGAIACWSPLTTRLINVVDKAHQGSVLDIGFAILQGRVIMASCALDGALKLYDLPSLLAIGEPLIEHPTWLGRITDEQIGLDPPPQRYFPIDISGIVADRYIRLCGDSNEITAYALNIENNEMRTTVRFDSLAVDWFCSCIAHGDALDNQLIAGAFDGSIRVWDLNRRLAVGTDMRMEDDLVTALVVRDDSGRKLIVSGGGGRCIYLWDLGTRKEIKKFITPQSVGGTRTLDIRRLDGRLFVAAGFESGSIIVWDGDSGVQIGREMVGHESEVTAVIVEMINNRPTIISGGGGGLRRWDIIENQADAASPSFSQRISPGVISSMTSHPAIQGRAMLAAGTDDGTVHLLDLESGSAQNHFQLDARVRAIAFGQLGGRAVVAAGTYEGSLQVWDLSTRILLSNQSLGSCFFDIGLVDDKLLVAFVDVDDKFRLEDIETAREIATPTSLDFPFDERIGAVVLTEVSGRPIGILQATDSGIIYIYDMLEGRLLRTIDAKIPLPSVLGAANIKEMTIVVSLCSDSCMRAWNVSTGEMLSESSVEYEWVTSTAVGELGGNVVVIGFEWGEDGGMIRMWRLPDWLEFFKMSLPLNIYAISIQDPFVLIGGEKGILCLRVDPSG